MPEPPPPNMPPEEKGLIGNDSSYDDQFFIKALVFYHTHEFLANRDMGPDMIESPITAVDPKNWTRC